MGSASFLRKKDLVGFQTNQTDSEHCDQYDPDPRRMSSADDFERLALILFLAHLRKRRAAEDMFPLEMACQRDDRN